ncbi:MAG: DNA polymerase II [Myxococcota bacterium]|nr:DNA polymerase II [Myxococcota bacterium]
MRATGFLLQPTYRVRDGRPVVQLFGRLEDDGAFLVEDDRFRPYFFVAAGAAERLGGREGLEIRPSPLRALDGREVLEVVAAVPADVPRLRDRLETGDALESDVRFPFRYLNDLGIRSGVEIEGEARRRGGLLRFRNPVLRPAEVKPALRVLSIDLETSPDASRIFSAALVGGDADEVHLVAEGRVDGAVCHADEPTLLQAVMDRISVIDPDVLVGWNVVDFDLRVWAKRCQALGMAALLGRVPGDVRFQEDIGYTRQTRAQIPGRVVLDGIELVRDALRLEDYRLETVARAVLGRGKLIDAERADAALEIARRYREDPAALVAYNREDARLVLDILEHEGLLALAVERSLLSGMPLDRVGASIASFDRLYLPALRRRGFVAPSVDTTRKSAGVRGGALLEPVPGLHENVAVYDFKSLYPSLIRTFNLDPLAHARAADDALEAPNGARFDRGEAILPGLIDRFMTARESAKARGDRHADQAIKIMMNALFGVLGAGSCRFFDPAIANAITGFGQQTLRWTGDAFSAAGVPVLYGDTDSVFVQLDDPERAEALRERVEAEIAERIRREYRVEPRLELEYERLYTRLFLPRVRGGRGASHKRYAGWADGRLVVVGLESVRRDWPAIARRLQEGMFERLFTDRPVMPFVKALTDEVLAGQRDDELIYVKRVRKASLERYTATTPPHVQAARKLGARAGRVVRYVIAANGPEPVEPGAPVPADVDRRHYVEKVLRPVADAILVETGGSFDEALGAPRQLSLL